MLPFMVITPARIGDGANTGVDSPGEVTRIWQNYLVQRPGAASAAHAGARETNASSKTPVTDPVPDVTSLFCISIADTDLGTQCAVMAASPELTPAPCTAA